MNTPDFIARNHVYNYEALDTYFDEITSPQETAGHLDHLLHFLIYYEHKEDMYEFYDMYCEIFELKQVLQAMTRVNIDGNK